MPPFNIVLLAAALFNAHPNFDRRDIESEWLPYPLECSWSDAGPPCDNNEAWSFWSDVFKKDTSLIERTL